MKTSASLAVLAGLLLASLLVGCSNLAAVSSGHTGCAAGDIVIADDQPVLGGGRTWTATCKDKVHYCSETSGGGAGGSQVSCRQASEPSAPAQTAKRPAPATPGCLNDMQCKGDRVCKAGACVDPPKASPSASAAGPAPSSSAAPSASASASASAKAPSSKAPRSP